MKNPRDASRVFHTSLIAVAPPMPIRMRNGSALTWGASKLAILRPLHAAFVAVVMGWKGKKGGDLVWCKCLEKEVLGVGLQDSDRRAAA